MDARRFDALLRSLTTGGSRRRVLAALTTWLLAAFPARFGADVGARKKRKGKKANPDAAFIEMIKGL